MHNFDEIFNKSISLIEQIHPLDEYSKSNLKKIAKLTFYPKNTFILKETQIADKYYFLYKGLTRSYFHRNGREATTWFCTDGRLFTNYKSMITGLPSTENIITIEDSWIIEFSKQDIEKIFETHPCVNTLARKISELYFLMQDDHLYDMLYASAAERLAKFEIEFKPYLDRIKSKYIASYLGLTPETISRMRSLNKAV
jgi:CRP-like cAMP-binding protein